MKRTAKWYKLIWLVLALLVLAALVYGEQRSLRRLMASWTGEEDLREQIKGTLALAYLRLTRLPPRTDPYVLLPMQGSLRTE
ncbi:MAG: hypothetical protein J7M05_08450 [Anaerolineae bacterium]|nr:hypothetical protein [Anaerolineae bacterium]